MPAPAGPVTAPQPWIRRTDHLVAGHPLAHLGAVYTLGSSAASGATVMAAHPELRESTWPGAPASTVYALDCWTRGGTAEGKFLTWYAESLNEALGLARQWLRDNCEEADAK